MLFLFWLNCLQEIFFLWKSTQLEGFDEADRVVFAARFLTLHAVETLGLGQSIGVEPAIDFKRTFVEVDDVCPFAEQRVSGEVQPILQFYGVLGFRSLRN